MVTIAVPEICANVLALMAARFIATSALIKMGHPASLGKNSDAKVVFPAPLRSCNNNFFIHRKI